METTGKLIDRAWDFQTGKLKISFILDQLPSDLDDLMGCDAVDITAKRHREKRSLNANAYFHLLCSRIAEVLHTGLTDVKNRLIREYGAFEFVDDKIPTFRLKAEYEDAMLSREDLHVKPVGRDYTDGCEWVRFAFMRGSHTYNTAEMSRLIDGTVEEAKELGIETMTPDQIERMKSTWKGSDLTI